MLDCHQRRVHQRVKECVRGGLIGDAGDGARHRRRERAGEHTEPLEPLRDVRRQQVVGPLHGLGDAAVSPGPAVPGASQDLYSGVQSAEDLRRGHRPEPRRRDLEREGDAVELAAQPHQGGPLLVGRGDARVGGTFEKQREGGAVGVVGERHGQRAQDDQGLTGLDGAASDGRPGDADNIATEVEDLIGTRFPDTLTGSAVNNVLNGLTGPDTLNGLGGNDTFPEGEFAKGADDFSGGTGRDTASYSQRRGKRAPQRWRHRPDRGPRRRRRAHRPGCPRRVPGSGHRARR